MPSPKKQTDFESKKSQLNPEQKQAVELIEGPVMVLAGPGTGKTQVLALRIAEILTQTDTNPRSILALTFTESGVTAMRERLVSLIGPTAYAVAIYTFHGFANRVINESGAEFYKSHNLEQIDDIRQFKTVASLLDSGSFQELRPTRSPYFFVSSILRTIKNLKNEAITPDILRHKTLEAINNLESDPESLAKTGKSKGQLKQTVVTKINQLKKTLELADIYDGYESLLVQSGRYDYEDMILFVLGKFRTNGELLAQYQERFLYLLVDEYQDTNNAQNELIRILTRDVESPNLFVVGDDKQSIYRFQGASTANILNFREWYPESRVVVLRQNYRSGQPILDTADSLIRNNQGQLTNVIPDLDAKLQAQTDSADLLCTVYTSPDQEILGLTADIAKRIESGVKPGEIAVIYRENREAHAIAELMAKRSLPYVLEAGTDVLSDPDVGQLITVLKLAHDPDDSQAFFRYLHTPYSGVTTTDLLLFSRWFKDQTDSIFKALSNPKPEQLDVTWDDFLAARQKVEDWYSYIGHHSVSDSVEYILNQSGLLSHIITSNNHLDRLNRIRCFFDDVKRLSIDEPDATLVQLFERIRIRQNYRLPLVAAPLIDTAEGAVRLMTAHKSKGLEFECVYIPNLIEGLWSNSRARQDISIPEGLITQTKVSGQEELEEDRRLLYVALTRAKSTLRLSYSEYSTESKKLIASQFLSELGPSVHTQSATTILSPVQFFTPISEKFQTDNDRIKVLEIVKQQPISPTSLNSYLTCPAEYLYKHIYRVPGVREPDQAYGTAIHRALEEWGKWRKNKQPYNLNDSLKVFETSLHDQGLVARERDEFTKLGHTVLTQFFESRASELPAPLAVEYSFGPHQVLVQNRVPITGKLDVIEPIAGSTKVKVVDYKTGKVRSRNDIEGLTASSDGDYKRQLIFYTLLAESDPSFPYSVGEVELRFVDDDLKFTSEVFTISDAERADLKQLIISIYDEIIALHFDHTPHKKRFNHQSSLCDILG